MFWNLPQIRPTECKKKKKHTSDKNNLAQAVFWYKHGHSGPGGLFVSMVTGSSEVK